MAEFLSRTLIPVEGKELVGYSASPEQYEDDQYERYHKTVGCAFDQQMARENHRNILTAAALGKDSKLEETLRRQLPLWDWVQVGKSGQVKEYREE